jgi:cyanophycinase-like exopeptidase
LRISKRMRQRYYRGMQMGGYAFGATALAFVMVVYVISGMLPWQVIGSFIG